MADFQQFYKEKPDERKGDSIKSIWKFLGKGGYFHFTANEVDNHGTINYRISTSEDWLHIVKSKYFEPGRL